MKKAAAANANEQLSAWRTSFGARLDLQKYKANAIGLFALALKFGLDDLDTVASDAIVDGSNDKKLDLVYVDEEKRLAVVIQAYVAAVPKAAAPANKASDLNTAVGWLLNRSEGELPPEIKGQVIKLREALLTNSLDTIHFWYVHNCNESKNVRTELETVEQTARAALRASFPRAKTQVQALEVGDEQFSILYNETQSPILVHDDFEFSSEEGFTTSAGNWEAFVTALPAEELYDVYKKHGVKLFSANVRDYLGSRASDSNINNSIKNTAKDQPENFWVYNNGITALTNMIKHSRRTGDKPATLKLKGLSIVNGAQTTGAIGALTSRPKSTARIPIRFVRTDDPELIQEIVRYNNSQNQITASDFRSTDRTQKRLKGEISQIPSAEYDGGRRGGTGDAIKRRTKLLPSYTVGQALAAYHGDPLLAYHKKSEIWTNDATYSKFFDDHTSGLHIVFVYGLLRAVETAKNDLVEKSSNARNTLAGMEQAQLKYFRTPGATFILVAAISMGLEAILGQGITNKFYQSFGKSVSPSTAEQRWKPIVEVALAFAAQLQSDTGRLSGAELTTKLQNFVSLLSATSSHNSSTYQKFSAYVKRA